MSAGACLFCNRFEYKSDCDYICGSCVQILLSVDQAELKRAHEKAVDKGYGNKARAIESFLIPEETNVRKTKKSKRGAVRKKSLRMARPSRDKLRAQQAVV